MKLRIWGETEEVEEVQRGEPGTFSSNALAARQHLIEGSMGSTTFMFILMLSLVGCAGKEECVQRTSDGPWNRIGKEMPGESNIAKSFSTGGESALIKLLGAPDKIMAGEKIWMFESRREARHTWCAPFEQSVEHDQVFTIVRLLPRQGKITCEIESKEFISNRLMSAEAALQHPRTPLGFKSRECGVEAVIPRF